MFRLEAVRQRDEAAAKEAELVLNSAEPADAATMLAVIDGLRGQQSRHYFAPSTQEDIDRIKDRWFAEHPERRR